MIWRRLFVALAFWIAACVPSGADTVVGTFTVYYRFNAGGCFGGGNPYFCTTIPPGPIHIDAEPGQYRVDVNQINNPGAGGGGVQVWSGDASGGIQFTPGTTGVTFPHAAGQITLYYNDWVASDNDPTAWTIVTLTKLDLTYSVTDVGPFEDPTAINENGDVVGYRNVGGHWHALLWRQGELTDLGTFGETHALAMNINNAGQIALTLNSGGSRHALLTGDTLSDIAPTNGFPQIALNNAGDVAGESGGLPYVSSGGAIQFLPIGACGSGSVRDLNDNGVVVGYVASGPCGGQVPAVWLNGVYTQLLAPPGVTLHEAHRVNAAGQIAAYGSSLVLFDSDGQGGYIGQDLGHPAGASYCAPWGINDATVIVGSCGPSPRAVIWDAANGIRDLNAIAMLPPGVVLDMATGITNSGLILARGVSNGEFRAYLLTPPVSNQPPVAVPGPSQTTRLGETVDLDGTASFDDNTPTNALVYLWQFASKPAGSSAILTGADTSAPSFVPDVSGDYRVGLVVTDEGGLSSAPVEVLVSPNAPPTVNAGLDRVGIVGTSVELTGSATDPEGDTLTVEWTLTSKPAGSSATMAPSDALASSFVPDLPGTYAARLSAADFLGAGAPDEVQIVVTTAASYAASQTQSASAEVVALPPGDVTNGGNQNALSQLLAAAVAALDAGDTATAVQKLQQAVSRTDGCAVNGVPDPNGPGRDWITSCSAQSEVYPLLIDALAALAP